MNRRTLLVASLCVAPGAFAQSETPSDTPAPPPHLSRIAELPLTLPDGSPIALGEAVPLGRPAIVHFWATWCPPCIQEARHLAGVRRDYARDRLTILGINLDRTRDEGRLNTFLNRGRVNFDQALGDPALYQAFGNTLPIRLPRLYVFYPDGAPVTAFGRYSNRTLGQIDQAVARAFAGA